MELTATQGKVLGLFSATEELYKEYCFAKNSYILQRVAEHVIIERERLSKKLQNTTNGVYGKLEEDIKYLNSLSQKIHSKQIQFNLGTKQTYTKEELAEAIHFSETREFLYSLLAYLPQQKGVVDHTTVLYRYWRKTINCRFPLPRK